MSVFGNFPEDLYKAVKFNDFGLVQAMMREAHQFDLEQVDPLTGLTLTMIATQNCEKRF